MPRPRVEKSKRHNARVDVLLTKRERDALDEACKPRPRSEWIRETILPFLRAWLR